MAWMFFLATRLTTVSLDVNEHAHKFLATYILMLYVPLSFSTLSFLTGST